MEKFETVSRQIAFVADKKRDVIRKPYYKCYCCEDTGYVNYHLVLLIIPNYQPKSDKIPVCNRYDCQSSVNIGANISANILDERFSSDLCERLHKHNLSEWQKWELKAQKRKNEITDFLNKVGGEK